MLNIYKVLLLLSQPFVDTNSGRHKMIHPRYCQFARRVEYKHHSKLTTSNAFTLDGVDDKMQSGIFPFISDVFFLTLHAMYTLYVSSLAFSPSRVLINLCSVAPALQTYRDNNNALHTTRALINRQRANFGEQWLSSAEGQRQQNLLNSFYLIVDSYDGHIADPQTLEMTVKVRPHLFSEDELLPAPWFSLLHWQCIGFLKLINKTKTTDLC